MPCISAWQFIPIESITEKRYYDISFTLIYTSVLTSETDIILHLYGSD